MAHFAEIVDGTVVRVVVVHNNELLDENGVEQEAKGVAFCKSLWGGDWVQTSYNSNFRANFACIGATYDANRDAFIFPQPFPSWLLDEQTLSWVPPIAYPQDGEDWAWDEETVSWISLESWAAKNNV